MNFIKRKFIIIILIAFIQCITNGCIKHFAVDTIIVIADETVTMDEFEYYILQKRALVFNQSTENKAMQASYTNREKNINGKPAIEILKDTVLKQIVHDKIILILAKKEGLIDSISFSYLQSLNKNDNHLRKQAINNGEVIYGPVEKSFDMFLPFYLSNLEIILKEKHAKKFVPDEEKMKAYYHTNKDSVYKNDSLLYLQVKISFDKQHSATDIKTITEQYRSKIESCKNPEEVYVVLDSIKEGVIDTSYVFVSMYRGEGESEDDTNLFSGPRLKPGTCSSIKNTNNIVWFYYSVKLNRGYYEYSEIKNRIEYKLQDEAFDNYLNTQIENAEIRINRKLYNN